MNALILIGVKKSKSGLQPESLYCGLDGVELEKAATDAAATKEYVFIGKIVNPSCTPMPIDPTPTTRTTPEFNRPKAHKPAQPKGQPKHMQERDDLIAKQRAERLTPTPPPKRSNPLEKAANGAKGVSTDVNKELDEAALAAQASVPSPSTPAASSDAPKPEGAPQTVAPIASATNETKMPETQTPSAAPLTKKQIAAAKKASGANKK
jgi:hypothetical protein